MMNNTKIDTYIGFAVRSNKVIFGVDRLLKSRNYPIIVLHDKDLGVNSLKQVTKFCEDNNICKCELETGHLAKLLKRDKVKVLAITDVNLGNAIKSQLEILI